jgi:hypothetical protein
MAKAFKKFKTIKTMIYEKHSLGGLLTIGPGVYDIHFAVRLRIRGTGNIRGDMSIPKPFTLNSD